MNRSLLLFFAFLGSLVVARASAQEVETFEYTVEAGDSCGRIAQRFYGAWRRYDVILRFNPRLAEGSTQRGACGPFLRPGVVLTLPRTYVEEGPSERPGPTPGAPEPDARVTRTVRDVEAAEPEATAWQRARRGTPLWRGWRVNTLERSGADVTFRDESRIVLRENTLVVIYGGETRARRETASATLERGQLRSRLAELRMQVQTPSANADLGSGSALVGVDDEGTTRVSNFEGDAATVRGASGRVAVRGGFGSKVARGARPSRPRPLPPTPTWVEGPTRFVGLAPHGATVEGSWSPVDVARRYRVEVVDAEGDLVAATEVPSSVTRFELHRFPEGTYRVRISTIDGDFFESRPSEARAIEVALGRVDVGGGEALPDPSEEPTPPVVVLGSRFVAPPPTRCALGDADPVPEVVLAPEGPGELRCLDAEGRPTGRFPVEVRSPALNVEMSPLVEGRRAELRVRSTDEVPPDLRLRGEGVDVAFESEGDVLIARFDVPETVEGTTALALSVVAGDVVLAETSGEVATESDEVEPDPVTPTDPEAPTIVYARPPTPFTAVGHPDLLALRDAPGDDLSFSFGLGSLGDQPAHDAHVRLDAALSATFAERVRASVGLTRDFIEVGDRATPRGDGDVRFELDATSRGRGPWRVGGGVGLWLPSGRQIEEARTLDTYRLTGSFDVDYVRDRLALRTRQGTVLDTSDGLRAWASTYGASWRALPKLSLGAEVQLSIGRDSVADELQVLAAVGLGSEVRVGASGFSLGARVGLGDDTSRRVGMLSIVLGWRISFDETIP
ncbi:MAG: FecR domain-containing protein [Sandaracinus sp.]|nr:FecR domain-containing protein [Sandaracinus sp.]